MITSAENSPDYLVEPDIISGDLYYTLSDDGTLTVYSLSGNFGSPNGEYADLCSSFIQYQDKIKRIVMSETITYIGSQSFDGLELDVPIVLSKSLKNIDGYAFARCPNLTIELDAENPYFKLVSGVLYTSDMTQLVYASPTLTGDFTVPSSVTTVCDGAFVCSNFESIVIPDSVTTMMTNAYGDDPEWGLCGRIFVNALTKRIVIGKNVEMLGRCAVNRCPNIESLTILGTDTAFEDDFVIDADGIDIVYIPHNSKAEVYMNTYYNGKWEYISEDEDHSVETITTTACTRNDLVYSFDITSSKVLNNEFLGIALYDNDGRMMELEVVEYEMGTNWNVSISTDKVMDHAKIFVWSSIKDIIPLGSAEYISISEQ